MLQHIKHMHFTDYTKQEFWKISDEPLMCRICADNWDVSWEKIKKYYTFFPTERQLARQDSNAPNSILRSLKTNLLKNLRAHRSDQK